MPTNRKPIYIDGMVAGHSEVSVKRAPIPQAYNNPGDIKWGNWAQEHGAIGRGGRGGHAVFAIPKEGHRALEELLAERGAGSKSLREINKWYAEDPSWSSGIGKIMNVDPTKPIGEENIPALARAIERQEGFHANKGPTFGKRTPPSDVHPGPSSKSKNDTRTPEQIKFDLVGANIAAATQAAALGFDPKNIEVVADPIRYNVGGKSYTEAGHFDPATGKITLRLNPGVSQEQRAGHTIPHEIMHAKVQKWLQSEPFEQGPLKGVDDKAYLKKLSKTGPSISEYAGSWWKQANQQKTTEQQTSARYQAMNETLAEMARIKYGKGYEKGDIVQRPGKPLFPPAWEDLYHQVMRKQGPTFRSGIGPGTVEGHD